MAAKLTLDKLGRIVLPKPVRDKLQLPAGDRLELENVDDRIMLRPLRGTAQLRKKRGVWVFHCGEPLSAATVRQIAEPTMDFPVNTLIASQAWMPSICVPAGFTETGIPVGLEIIAYPYHEPDLFRLAYSFEQMTHYRRAPESTRA